MSKKIDERLPREIGEGVLPNHASIQSPWNKLVSYHDCAHYCQRYTAVVGAALMQAYRILVPDYVERSTLICQNAYNRLHYTTHNIPGYRENTMDNELNVHPFCAGNFTGGLSGDAGDDGLLMCGRVNDFGSYRVEKELDVCYWDIIGSELCRSTTQSLQAVADSFAEMRHEGPRLELHMVEAKGCGDRHCRIVGECRKKYPMPEHDIWECFGPVATADQIKFTTEEYTVKESMVFREECGNRYISGTCKEDDSTSLYGMYVNMTSGCTYLIPTLEQLIMEGKVTEEFVSHVIKCVMEAAGKAYFAEGYAKEAFCHWVGAPRDVDDGRLMGAHIEMFLQAMAIPYEIEAFNKDEVIYRINRLALSCYMPRMCNIYVAYWYGMTKTLVNAMWSLWEEQGDAPAEQLRIKIAKKIDKFC